MSTETDKQPCAVCGTEAIFRTFDRDYDRLGLQIGQRVTFHCAEHRPKPDVVNAWDCAGKCSPDHCDWPACKPALAPRAFIEVGSPITAAAFAAGVRMAEGYRAGLEAGHTHEPDRGNPV